MLIDGVEIPAGAEIVKTVPDNKGTTLPGTVTNGSYFELTAVDGANQPGIYLGVSDVWQYVGVTQASQAYDLAVTVTGVPGDGDIVMRFVATRRFTLPALFAGCKASAAVAATASTVFDLKQNGSAIGSITFAASGTTGSFAQSGSGVMTFAVGDVLTISAPATADTTLADISVTLLGTMA